VVKWDWSFGDGKTSQDQDPTHIFTTPGLYDIQLITTNYAGCSDTLIKTDFVEIDGPYGSVVFAPDTICSPEEVLFEHDFTNTVYFIWNYGDGSIESYNYSNYPDSTKHNYIIGGTFQPTIELIDASGCFYALPQQPVILADSIDARFETTGLTICDVANIPFTNTSRQTFDNSYYWNFGNGDTSTQNSPIYSYINDSLYEVTLTQISPLGCIDSSKKSLTVFNAPYPSLQLNNTNYCIPSTSDFIIEFANKNFTPDSAYFFIDNELMNSDSVQKIITSSGDHTVQMIIKYGSGACLVDSTITIPFYKWPVADYTYSPSNNSMEEPVIFFKNNSLNSSSWEWDFDDFDQSTAKDVGHNFNNAGLFNVRLIASNDGGCSDTIIHEITMSPYNFVKLPSAFSPNGDGQNETFGILRAGELTINEFKIFNRWGNVVFETNNSNDVWDGTRKGKDQDIGTYIYYINGTKKNGETVEIKGNFTLLR
jgi:gliding motility-associated-like protein